jgi:cell division protein ZipA
MDPDLLRLLLIVLGVLLVLGIYLWDRYQRSAPPGRQRFHRERPDPGDAPSADWGGLSGTHAETEGGATPPRRDHAPAASRSVEAGDDSADLDPDPQTLGNWSGETRDNASQVAMTLHFDAHGDSDYLTTDPALQDEVERLLVVMHLATRGQPIRGESLAGAMASLGLTIGDMSIYHRRDPDRGQVLFSVASLVEPGTFPADLAGFSTPGLSMFTQLPGPRDGLEIFAEMLAVAQGLAERLDLEVRDERHNKLTRQMQDHVRESIVEHRRRVRLARSRH